MLVQLCIVLAVLLVPAYAERHVRDSPISSAAESNDEAIVTIYDDDACTSTRSQPITVPGPYAARCYTPDAGSLSWTFTCSATPSLDQFMFHFSHWSTRGCAGDPVNQMSFTGTIGSTTSEGEADGSTSVTARVDESNCGVINVLSGGRPYTKYAKVRCEFDSSTLLLSEVRPEDEASDANPQDITEIGKLLSELTN